MSHPSKSSFLKEEIGLLVQHFGAARVRAALAKVSVNGADQPQKVPNKSQERAPIRPTITAALELIHKSDPLKHRLLNAFHIHLKDRTILSEAHDIRHFAQLIGFKHFTGKSRKAMIPTLMRFLIEQPTERLLIDLKKADNISEQQRQQGFSVLTDKLLGKS